MATIFVFGFDVAEAAQLRRIRSLRAAGHEVHSASFRRDNMNASFVPDWPNLHLGRVDNESFGKRLFSIAVSVLKVAWKPGALPRADAIIARNFDMLAIAWASRLLCGDSRTPLIYECLDIHGLFTRRDRIGATMRWLERRLLARTDLLLVSSNAFLRAYFVPVQQHRGRSALIENKLWFDDTPAPRPAAPRQRREGEQLVLGWVGSIRCSASLALLLAAADAMGGDVRISIHGNVHRHAVPEFDREVGKRANVAYHGPYAYPQDLAKVYGSCDLVWAQDLWQRGANSDWLLPNRIYEASWFGCPSVAVADTETGRRVASRGLGFIIDEATPEALLRLLRGLKRREIADCAAGLLSRPEEEFRLSLAEIDAALRPVLRPSDRVDGGLMPAA
jgi:succinoglycan biosynthesis protein ExoL